MLSLGFASGLMSIRQESLAGQWFQGVTEAMVESVLYSEVWSCHGSPDLDFWMLFWVGRGKNGDLQSPFIIRPDPQYLSGTLFDLG